MPDPLDPTSLGKVTCRLLEDAAFLFAEPTQLDFPFNAPVFEATISFTGPRPGTITLRAPVELGAEAAANLLGLEAAEAESREHAGPAIGELLNMLAGLLLEEWFGTAAACSLGLPVVTSQASAPAKLEGVFTSHLLVGEQRLEVAANFHGGAGGRS